MEELHLLNDRNHDEIKDVFDFLNRHLRPNGDWSIIEEYPTTFTPKNYNNIHVIRDEKEVLSHAAVRYILSRSPQAVFKIAAIGSVVTSSEHRRQGLSQKLLNACLEKAQIEDADMAILWTNLFDFYRKLGFELTGYEVAALIDSPLPEANHDLTIREGAGVSPEALLRIYNKHSVNSVRTPEEIRKYLQIPNSRVYTAWDRKGFLQAYAIEGKGADLDGYIHEWGGGVSKLLPLFNYIRQQQNRPITVIVPKHSQALIREFEAKGVQCHEGFLGMVKLLNPEGLCKKMQNYARAMGLADVIFKYENQAFVLGVEGEETLSLDEKEVLQLVFGPNSEQYFVRFRENSRQVFQKLFPLPLWIWGWDSI